MVRSNGSNKRFLQRHSSTTSLHVYTREEQRLPSPLSNTSNAHPCRPSLPALLASSTPIALATCLQGDRACIDRSCGLVAISYLDKPRMQTPRREGERRGEGSVERQKGDEQRRQRRGGGRRKRGPRQTRAILAQTKLNIPSAWRGTRSWNASNGGPDTFVTDVSTDRPLVSILCSICHRRFVLSYVRPSRGDEFAATRIVVLPAHASDNVHTRRPLPPVVHSSLVIPTDINFTVEH